MDIFLQISFDYAKILYWKKIFIIIYYLYIII